MTSPLDWIRDAAATREGAGLTRRLTTTKSGDGLDLAGNDYLGLRTHPAVIAGAVAAAETYGGGAGASRLVTGTLDVHDELEAALAALTGAPSALALSQRVCREPRRAHHARRRRHAHRQRRARPRQPDRRLPAVAGRRLGVAAQRPRARRRAARPAREPPRGRRRRVDLLGARRRRADRRPHRASPPRPARSSSSTRRTRWASSAPAGGGPRRRRRAVRGRARRRHRHPVEVPCGTGRCGARARPSCASTSSTPPARSSTTPASRRPSAGAALAALGVLRDHPELTDRVHANAARLAAACGVDAPAGAVMSVPMPGPHEAVEAVERARAHGIRIGCFRPPSTPDGSSRLRLTAHADHSRARPRPGVRGARRAHRPPWLTLAR